MVAKNHIKNKINKFMRSKWFKGALVSLIILALMLALAPIKTRAVSVDFGYAGGVQYWVAPYNCTVTLEVWGAQGGNDIANTGQVTYGGYGGYASGQLYVSAGQVLYIFVGGQGQTGYSGGPRAYGGWNGGGAAGPVADSGGGGGATDIRIWGTGLENRVIVAGGGGGAGNGKYSYTAGGTGGGWTGGDGGSRTGSSAAGTGATQNSGGTFKQQGYDVLGQFGQGATNTYDGGGGGGGYWGGGVRSGYDNGGGGGSGYVGGVSNGSMANGWKDGHGYARITYYDNIPPAYDSAYITNVNKDGYDVYITGVRDDQSGINRVQFPSWSDRGGQDDLDGGWWDSYFSRGTNLGGGTWKYHVNVADHKYDGGTYYSHIYIYDNAGNQTAVGTQTYVDRVAPTIWCSLSPSSDTTGNVTITAHASDDYSGVAYITKPDGSQAWSTSTTYTVSKNGTYAFTARDNHGNTSTINCQVNNIIPDTPTNVSAAPTLFNAGTNLVVSFAHNETDYTSAELQMLWENGTVYGTYSVAKGQKSYTFNTNGWTENLKWKYKVRLVDGSKYGNWSAVSNLVEVNSAPAIAFGQDMQDKFRNVLPFIDIPTVESDANANLSSVSYKLATPEGDVVWTASKSISGSSATTTAQCPTPEIGQYVLTATVADTLGRTNSCSKNITVFENHAPVITGAFEDATSGRKIIANVTVTDPDDDNVDIVSVKLHNSDNSVVVTGTPHSNMPSGTTVQYDFGYLVDGTYVMDVVAQDVYGMQATESFIVGVSVPKLLNAGIFHTDIWLQNVRDYNVWAAAQNIPERLEEGLFFRNEAFVIKVPLYDEQAPGTAVESAWAVLSDGSVITLEMADAGEAYTYKIIMPDDFWIGVRPENTKEISMRIFAQLADGRRFYVDKTAVTDGVEYHRITAN